MQYRPLGKTGRQVSALGFGCMRLPTDPPVRSAADIFDPERVIDEEQAVRMIRQAVERGVNYFDTAYPYHAGRSEPLLGRAVKHCRGDVLLATKLPTWLVFSPDDCDRFLDQQLARLDTSWVDVYLLHSLNRERWPRIRELKMLQFLERIVSDGRARHVGFSFHDDIGLFREVMDAFPWDVAQIQLNYLDRQFQAGLAGMTYAAERGLGVVVMEPLRGGKLTDAIPPAVRRLWNMAPVKRTPAEWALRWVWNHPEVSTVLSGMNNLAQLEENLDLADQATPPVLQPEELALVDMVSDYYRNLQQIECTSCAYCMPCPHGVNIPLNFSLYNDTFMFADSSMAYRLYNQLLSPEQKASNCQACGACLEHCPQGIEIIRQLKAVHERLGRTND
ncbi:MAG: aldo/keto reductase [Acidobacteria bacterium]|nr:aldo/keto reductase [Acidobacteriota bacterium]